MAEETPIFDPQMASTPSNLSINHFYKIHADGVLILRPPFQRNLVWNIDQKSFLVDSILRGLPVPEIYIQTDTTADGDERTIVVDGQQRISACLQFIDGDYRLTGDRELDIEWRNRKFNELPQPLKRRFRTYELIARKLPSVGDFVMREIFRRLNQTVEPLVAQELRHAAYTGPFIQLVEAAARHPMLEEAGVFSARDFLRRRNDELMAEIAYAVVAKAYPNKKDGLDDLFLTYERNGIPEQLLQDLERRLGRVFDQLEPIAAQIRKTRFRNKSDFYSLFVFLAKQAELLPVTYDDPPSVIGNLRVFSDLVNEIKREEAEGRSIDGLTEGRFGPDAVRYLRAVERAASDRLNRVRREEALRTVLMPALTRGDVEALTASDSVWRTEEEGSDEDAPESDAEERAQMQQVLLEE